MDTVDPLPPLPPAVTQALAGITTATLTTVLLKKGLRNCWVRGARPLRADQPRIVGRAFTLRFVPMREDLATPASWGNPISTRAAIEAMPAGCVAVVDAMGVTDAGIFGDILCARMARRGVAANPLHPGVIATNIFGTLPPLIGGLVALGRLFMKSVGQGAATTCYVATAPALIPTRRRASRQLCEPRSKWRHVFGRSS